MTDFPKVKVTLVNEVWKLLKRKAPYPKTSASKQAAYHAIYRRN